MEKQNYVNVQIEKPYREKLRAISRVKNNSMSNTAELLINEAYGHLFKNSVIDEHTQEHERKSDIALAQ